MNKQVAIHWVLVFGFGALMIAHKAGEI